ncbi:MAG: multiprotein bridging factor aMBF1 [Nanoarchaeota archaeon]
MASCEMCGTSGQMFVTMIEGARLSVCGKCSSLGKVIQEVAPPAPQKRKAVSSAKPIARARIIHIIVGDCANRVRQAREKSGLSQKEFAMKLNERESLIQHLENGQTKPSVDMALKLERLLNIKIIEEMKEEVSQNDEEEKTPSSGVLTLGDVIKIRKR